MPPKTIFKTYDIRGEYGKDLNKDVVIKIVKSLDGFFGERPMLVVGHDARASSPEIYRTVLANARYARCMKAGLMTTPMLYFLVNAYHADGGIMVTASHNPKSYNGLKIVARRAIPVSGDWVYRAVASLCAGR